MTPDHLHHNQAPPVCRVRRSASEPARAVKASEVEVTGRNGAERRHVPQTYPSSASPTEEEAKGIRTFTEQTWNADAETDAAIKRGYDKLYAAFNAHE